MKTVNCISHLSLIALAFGLFAFAGPVLAADTNTVEANKVDEAKVKAQADSLRSLLEAAGRNGLVDVRDPNAPEGQADPSTIAIVDPPVRKATDCLALAPLFDGGQGGFGTGLFTEMITESEATSPLARTLADLTDPAYDGRPLEIDLTRAADCGPSFLPWQALANPAKEMTAADEIILTSVLKEMDPLLRRQIGVRTAIRAGLAGNLRLSRRISDTLVDSDLHGQPRHDRDPEHVLLDAILKLSRDPVGARARLSWIAERDGPEQLAAIDLMRQIEAAPAAKSELKRLSKSPDDLVRLSAQQRLLATAIEDADIELVAELVTTTNNLTEDIESRDRLATRLKEALLSDDRLKAVQALDVIDRLEAKGVVFEASMVDASKRAIQRLTTDASGEHRAEFESSLTRADAPDKLSGSELVGYLGTVSSEMERYQEVLNRG